MDKDQQRIWDAVIKKLPSGSAENFFDDVLLLLVRSRDELENHRTYSTEDDEYNNYDVIDLCSDISELFDKIGIESRLY